MMNKQKVALVTGAGSGIGEEIALRLSRDGMAVVLVGRTLAKVEGVAEKIRQSGGEALPLAADVSSEESMIPVFDTIMDKYGRLDALASNAGIFLNDTFLDMPYDQWNKLISINLDGAFIATHLAAEIMKKQPTGGKIVVTLSQGGFAESDASFAYIMSKWAGRGLVRSLATRLAPYGINVNAIAPGNIMTPMMDYIVSEYAKSGAPEEAIRQNMETMAPLGRSQPASEMAAMVSYLVSDKAKNMVGFTMIDNGAMILGT